MAFTVGEAVRLEKSLVVDGAAESADSEAIIRAANAWFGSQSQRRDVLDPETFAFLCEVIRFPSDATARALAVGALRVAKRDAHSHPHRAAFAAKFAAQRIRALSGKAPLWSAIPLSAREESDAHALFEAAQGDRSYSDEELIQAVTAFIAEHGQDETMFGRLATDLSRLVQVITSSGAASQARETARAALTYFVVADDAIPDGAGFVGLLDDLYVVQRAVAEIDPKRGTILQLLDDVVRTEPLVRELRFDAADSAYPLTEFGLLNCGLVLHPERARSGIAVIVPTVGPLPVLVGFVTAMSTIRVSLRDQSWPDFQDGELLTNPESGASVIFHSYGRLADKSFGSCPAGEATHVCFLARPVGRDKSREAYTVKCFRPIDDVLSFRRATSSVGVHGGSAIFDRDNIRLGVLERLFGSAKPIVLPAARDRIVVVSPLAEARDTLQTLKIFGSPVIEVLPAGQAQILDSGVEYRTWSKANDGHGPLLTFVRSTADAAVLCDDSANRVAAVVAPVRAESNDIPNLARIADRGTTVLAVAEQRQAEAIDHLQKNNFAAWVWDDSWLNAVYWPCAHTDSNVIRDYELRVRIESTARITTSAVPLPCVGAAHASLERLQEFDGRNDNDLLQLLIGEGFGLLLHLCRLAIPATGEMRGLGSRLLRFRQSATRGTQWWPDEVVALANQALHALDETVTSLEKQNPKFDALVQWAAANPTGQIVCQRSQRTSLGASLKSRNVSLVDRPDGNAAALIPAWLQKERMNRLLFPPTAPDLTLLLYEPERAWHAAAERRYRGSVDRARKFASERPPFRRVAPTPPSSPLPPSPSFLDPDDFVVNMRRAGALNYLRTVGGDPVSARLVQFAGGYWAGFTELHRVHTVTHLVGADRSGDEEIRETVASELVPGDLVLLLLGTDRDALREAVDAAAPRGTRDIAAIWQRALRRSASGRTTDELVQRLAKAGCHRTPGTIERWLVDDSMIGPRGADDVRAILSVTRDDELSAALAPCLTAISTLRGLHVKMASVLAARVRERARQWLDAGAVPDELVEVQDGLVLATVESIDQQPVDVPRSIANRLQSDRPTSS